MPHRWFECSGEGKNLCFCRELNTSHAAHSHLLYWLSYPCSLWSTKWMKNSQCGLPLCERSPSYRMSQFLQERTKYVTHKSHTDYIITLQCCIMLHNLLKQLLQMERLPVPIISDAIWESLWYITVIFHLAIALYWSTQTVASNGNQTWPFFCRWHEAQSTSHAIWLTYLRCNYL